MLESIKSTLSNDKSLETMENFFTSSMAVNAKQFSLPLELNTIDACELPFDEISPRKPVEFKPCYFCNKYVLSQKLVRFYYF